MGVYADTYRTVYGRLTRRDFDDFDDDDYDSDDDESGADTPNVDVLQSVHDLVSGYDGVYCDGDNVRSW